MYATDYKGRYPTSLELLKKTSNRDGYTYMKVTLTCLACEKPYGYNCNDAPDNYTLWCGKEKSHIDIKIEPPFEISPEGCWPQYTLVGGLMSKD